MSIAIMGFCLLAVFGLLPVGLTSNAVSSSQTRAVDILTAISIDLRETPAVSGGETTTAQFRIPLKSGTSVIFLNDELELVPRKTARYRAAVILGAEPPVGPTLGRIMISWPAGQENISAAAGCIEGVMTLSGGGQ